MFLEEGKIVLFLNRLFTCLQIILFSIFIKPLAPPAQFYITRIKPQHNPVNNLSATLVFADHE